MASRKSISKNSIPAGGLRLTIGLSMTAIALSVLSVSGCTTLSNLTAGSQSRQQMLREQSAEFHRATDRGLIDIAMARVKPENRQKFIEDQQATHKVERVIEQDVDHVEFNDSSDAATISITKRYFRQPSYVVMERQETEKWVYDSTEGWMLEKSERAGAEGKDRPSTLRGSL